MFSHTRSTASFMIASSSTDPSPILKLLYLLLSSNNTIYALLSSESQLEPFKM